MKKTFFWGKFGELLYKLNLLMNLCNQPEKGYTEQDCPALSINVCGQDDSMRALLRAGLSSFEHLFLWAG